MYKILKRTIKYFRYDKKALLLGVLLSVVITFLGIVSSYSFKILIDYVLIGQREELLWPLEIIYIFIVILGAFLSIFQVYVFNKIAKKIILNIKERLFLHFLKIDYETYLKIEHSEVTNTLNYSTDALGNLISESIPQALSPIISIISIAVIMIVIDYRLALISFLVYPLLVFVNLYVKKKNSVQFEDYQMNRKNVLKSIDDSIKCRDEVWSYNIFSEITDDFTKNVCNLENSKTKLNVLYEFSRQAGWALIMVPYQAILYGIGGMWLIKNNDPSLGTLMIFSNFTNYLIEPIMNLVNLALNIGVSETAYKRIDRLMNLRTQENKFDFTNENVANINCLDFKYIGARENTLEGLSINIPFNKTTILWGASGSGKSTLLKIIYGFLTADKKISVCDKLEERDFLRSKSWAYFPQSPHILDGKVRDLFKMLSKNITDEKIWECLKLVGMDDYFTGKNGLDTEIANAENTFSGGEHRRLSLSLFLAYDAKVMLFDEPTASLDKENALKIAKIIQNLKSRNKSIVISTHDVILKDLGELIIKI